MRGKETKTQRMIGGFFWGLEPRLAFNMNGVVEHTVLKSLLDRQTNYGQYTVMLCPFQQIHQLKWEKLYFIAINTCISNILVLLKEIKIEHYCKYMPRIC